MAGQARRSGSGWRLRSFMAAYRRYGVAGVGGHRRALRYWQLAWGALLRRRGVARRCKRLVAAGRVALAEWDFHGLHCGQRSWRMALIAVVGGVAFSHGLGGCESPD